MIYKQLTIKNKENHFNIKSIYFFLLIKSNLNCTPKAAFMTLSNKLLYGMPLNSLTISSVKLSLAMYMLVPFKCSNLLFK